MAVRPALAWLKAFCNASWTTEAGAVSDGLLSYMDKVELSFGSRPSLHDWSIIQAVLHRTWHADIDSRVDKTFILAGMGNCKAVYKAKENESRMQLLLGDWTKRDRRTASSINKMNSWGRMLVVWPSAKQVWDSHRTFGLSNQKMTRIDSL